jgi:hypothetical protein
METSGRSLVYLTLSHRWGNIGASMTKKENYAARLSSIDCSELSLTFQHAISITRSLGISYLWIDAMSIVQDDEQDWEEECPKMASIYQHSLLTLFAADPSSPTSGLLHPRGEEKGKQPIASSLCYRDSAGERKGRLDLTYLSRYDETDILDPGWRSILTSRAWITQERIFSPRKLYFGVEQMYWECGQGRWLERTHSFAVSKHQVCEDGRSLEANITEKGLWAWWRDFVEQYSRCKLTYETDRLPAISGIAKQIHTLTDSHYIAGIWEEHLLDSLMWRRNQPNTLRRKDHHYTAPSWSWAAGPGACEFPHGQSQTRHSFLEILSLDVVRHGLDPYGRVKQGSLWVRGWIKVFPERHHMNDGVFSGGGRDIEIWHVADDHVEDSSKTVTVLLAYRDFQPRTTAPFFRLEGMSLKQTSIVNRYMRIGYADAVMHGVEMGWARHDLAAIHHISWTPSAGQSLSSMKEFETALPDRQWKQMVIEII